MTDLAQALPDRDYGFQMRFEKGSIASFFGPTAARDSLLAERRGWLDSDPTTCLAIDPEAAPLLDEAMALAEAARSLPPSGSPSSGPLRERARFLGEHWEPDYLLLAADAEGTFRLRAGCLCFPSHWDLGAKMGKPLTSIHGPVPGLNEQLGRQIDGFLRRIGPGVSWERANWGLARTPELNLHPSREIPRLDASSTLEDTWWRLERQSLVALPRSGGVLFGIRLEIRPLTEIHREPDSCAALVRALRTMPEAMARYKGLASARETLADQLEEGARGN